MIRTKSLGDSFCLSSFRKNGLCPGPAQKGGGHFGAHRHDVHRLQQFTGHKNADQSRLFRMGQHPCDGTVDMPGGELPGGRQLPVRSKCQPESKGTVTGQKQLPGINRFLQSISADVLPKAPDYISHKNHRRPASGKH